jgi:hypothetical protein
MNTEGKQTAARFAVLICGSFENVAERFPLRHGACSLLPENRVEENEILRATGVRAQGANTGPRSIHTNA